MATNGGSSGGARWHNGRALVGETNRLPKIAEVTPHVTRTREQSGGEEIANAISHGVGAVLSIGAAPVLIAHAAAQGNPAQTVGASVFAASMVLLYLASTLYHALPRSRAKRVFRVLEHSGIYLLIAGTYTPFTLGVLRGPWGWTLLGLIWGLAVMGIVLKACGGVRYPVASTAVYVAMGWLIVIAARPVWLRVPAPGIAWLVTGGLAYTIGVAFYAAKRLPFGHFVWHLFVLAGTACHFVAVMWYAA
jgi:hemolysin III